MELSRSVFSPLLPHSLPTAQQAAVLYANGRQDQAADMLRSALAPSTAGSSSPELWYMLLDLLSARGDWQGFEALSERFQAVFGVPAPQWLNEEEMARLPVEVRPGGPGYVEFSGTLDSTRAPQLERARTAARNAAIIHLDLSRVAALDAQGASGLRALLRFLPENGNAVIITGADHLAELLRAATESDPMQDGYWTLLLELHQLRGQQSAFQRVALEYALAVGVAPPVWQPPLMPVAPTSGQQEKRDEPRYQAGPEVIHLAGVILGAGDAQIVELAAFGAERMYVNINLSQLRRLDFSGGTAFAAAVNDLIAAGKTVRLLRPSSLVTAFLSTLNISADVKLIPVKRPL